MSASAILPVSKADFPTRGTAADKLAFASRHAMAATGLHFASAEFRLWESAMELRMRPDRVAKGNSLDERETLMACGTVLEFTQLALRRHGCLGRIEFFPGFDEPDLVARVHTAPSCKRDPDNDRLYAAMGASAARTLPPAEATSMELAMALLLKTAARERSWIEFARCESSRARLREIASPPGRLQVAAVRLLDQDSTFSASTGRSATGWFRERLIRWRRPQLAVTISAGGQSVSPKVETAPTMFAVVKTKTDDKHGWLAAGHSIGRLQLQARDLALGWTVKLAPLRSPRLRAQLRPEFGHKGFVQAIVCFDFHPLQPTASPLEAGRSTSLAIGARTQV